MFVLLSRMFGSGEDVALTGGDYGWVRAEELVGAGKIHSSARDN
jgi:hypothetical protein